IVISPVLPREVAGLEDVELAARQPRVQEFSVARRHERVAATGDDLNRGPDVTQSFRKDRQLGGIAAHVRRRLGESIARVRAQVVLTNGLGEYVPLDAFESLGDDVASIEGPESAHV